MWSSMVLGSLILLLLATRAYGLGRLDMQLHAAQHHQKLHNKVDSQKEEIPADFTWQRPPSSPSRRRAVGVHNDASDSQNGLGGSTAPEHRLTTSTGAGRAAQGDGEVKKTRTHRGPGGLVAPRLIHEDYVGPSGHSPNHHHRAIPCGGPCKH